MYIHDIVVRLIITSYFVVFLEFPAFELLYRLWSLIAGPVGIEPILEPRNDLWYQVRYS